jgi:hypothetical protein
MNMAVKTGTKVLLYGTWVSKQVQKFFCMEHGRQNRHKSSFVWNMAVKIDTKVLLYGV